MSKNIKSIKNKSGKIYIKSNVELVLVKHKEMDLRPLPFEIREIVIDPTKIEWYRKALKEDSESEEVTCLGMDSGDEWNVLCGFDEFEIFFLNL